MFPNLSNLQWRVGIGGTAFDLATCRLLVEAAQLAYKTPAEITSHVCANGADSCEVVEDRGTETLCFVAARREDVVVSFRGTANLRNWITDLQIHKVGWEGCFVHAGFAQALESIWWKLEPILINHFHTRSGVRFHFVGHSLGGALATLGAYKHHLIRNLPLWSVYTFGSPRVGGIEFQTRYDAWMQGATLRLVHEEDIVPRALSYAFGYRHVGTEIFLDAFGRTLVNPPLTAKLDSDIYGILRAFIAKNILKRAMPDFLADHVIAAYMERLKANVIC